MTAPQVGVLVPVRLETRFVVPGRGRRWRLRVRVVPDAVSITNHDDLASTVELDAVEAMWRAAGGQGLESPEGRRAWRALAAAVGAERAAWLARTFPPVTGPGGQISIDRPNQTRTDMRAPRVMGLPPTMEIWIARGGQAPAHAATLSVLTNDIDLDLDDPDSTSQPWWTSFPEAVRVGLAAEIDLGTAQPIDIDAVYVVGIGGGDPGPLLTAQANSGSLGIVPPGSATSSVNGEAALSLGDTDTWRRLVPVGPTAQAGTVAVSTALAGAPVVHGVVGGDADHRPLNRAVVGALWPALWGHSLANVWGYATEADELGLWAAANLVPEGPLPSMRIGTQPYGLLPATSLRRWRSATGDPAIEARLVPLVRELVGTWAAVAERQAAQRQADALHDLVRNPTATRYEWRWMLPTTLAHAVSFRFNQPVPAADLGSWWARQTARTPRLDAAATPTRQLVSVGWGHEVELSLVEPDDLPAGTDTASGLSRLAAAPVAELLSAGPGDGGVRASPPWGTSVLTELARHSLLASAAAVARSAAGQSRALVEPVSADRRSATETETWATRLRSTDLGRRNDPAVGVRRNVIEGLQTLAGEEVVDIDRALRAALDTATNRLDPWATAIAWRRLQDLAATPRTLGVYGWVDAPRPRTSAGDHRYVLAPSTEQAAVAAILRDRALRDPDADRWHMDLTSDAIRGALRLAEETREGSHPAESLGRMVEAIVNRPDVIDRLRDAFPSIRVFLRSDMRVRRVCDGVAVLDAAENRPAELSQLGVRPAQLTALAELAAAVDALADLHVAEAALVSSRDARAPCPQRPPPPPARGCLPTSTWCAHRERAGSSTPSPWWSCPTRPLQRERSRAPQLLPTRRSPPTSTNVPETPRARHGRGPQWTRPARRSAPSHSPASACARATRLASARGTCATWCAMSAVLPASPRPIRRDTPSCVRSRPPSPECRRLPRTSARRPTLPAQPPPSLQDGTQRCATRLLPQPPTRVWPRRPPPPRPHGAERWGGSRGGGSCPSPPKPAIRPSADWSTASAARRRCWNAA